MRFPNERAALEYIDKHKELKLIKAHVCNEDTGVWHVTRQTRSATDKFRSLEMELHAMTTIREHVISYMEFWYEKKGKYKFHTKELTDAVLKKSPNTPRNSVAQEISKMKQAKIGLIVGLDESVPDLKNAKYFALAKHLDAVTKPTIKAVPEQKGGEKNVTDVKPTAQAINPFDKVNSQLGEILSKLNGLVQGYAEHTEALTTIRQGVVTGNGNTALDISNLANIVNDRLGNLRKDDAFIYRVCEELDNRLLKTEERFGHKIKDSASADNSEDYKRGVKDGIKLAVEMGLVLPDA